MQVLSHSYTLQQQQQQEHRTQKKMTHTQGTLAVAAAEWLRAGAQCLSRCALCTALAAALIAARLPVQQDAQLE
jgi:hypothetical protein